ncbi:lipocalin family protein [Riemerella columbina]|uniref:lipocalin family protein n=1 Tax=Riemerella columbina TaxID=103810 RepID=UPI00035DEB5B|nr:lipocalin family protein [Riemerella columbina]
MIKNIILGTLVLTATACVNIPEGVTAVQNFEVERYMGTWYEVARFDFKFEKNMKNVTATYTLQPDGSVKVLNKGYDTVKNKWKEAEGKAKFVGDSSVGRLKVSFFGPFYGGYNVVMMEPAYETALIMGNDTDYIWFLSRQKTLPEAVKQKFLAKAKAAGYDTSRLVWTVQD